MSTTSAAFASLAHKEAIKDCAFYLAMLASNAFLFLALQRLTMRIELKEILSEKDPDALGARAETVTAARNASATPAETPAPVPTSYSRTSAFLGSLVLAAMLLGTVEYALWAIFFDPGGISNNLTAVSKLFLAGSALFAPYAFNQVGQVFKPNS
jgi:hypothetical protein